jgi:hypothetical protein
MKAYKVFNENWTCREFQYEVGKTYELLDSNGNLQEPKLCSRGFHACKKVQDCFSYYDFHPSNKIAEVELSGIVIGDEEDKQCSNIITIVKELSWLEMLELANTGKGNSGCENSGDMNSGHKNSGNRNSGNNNSGFSNSGDNNSGFSNSGDNNSGNGNSGNNNSGNFNKCDFETGYFNSKKSTTINVFNKPCSIELWKSVAKPDFINHLVINKWICLLEMSEQDKINHPEAYIYDGYLKTFTYKEAWMNAYKQASKREIELLKALPNFDKDVFFEITGIMVD